MTLANNISLENISSAVNGPQIFEVVDNSQNPVAGYLSFRLASTSTSDSLPTIELRCNAEEGFQLNQAGFVISVAASGTFIGSTTKTIGATSSAYVISDPAAFRDAMNFISGIEDHEAVLYARTTNPGILGKLWNDGGFLKFSDGTPFIPRMDFQDPRNSMYLGTLA